ncbi:MAG: glutamyl-Q tRNA(Asp) synthetase [Myxococcota bacterium]|jgi:glutamyl-Q tRNA(Asp) synthetase
MTVTGRLAPTPSGDLHLGNICAFAGAWLSARAAGGRVLLRMEDVDGGRARTDAAEGQRRDLEWLGLTWDEEVPAQSSRDYTPWLGRLAGVTYNCACTRRMIRASGGVYLGTCRDAGHAEGTVRFRIPSGEVTFRDRRWGTRTVEPARLGDPVLRRRDGVFAYTLAVVADDIADGVTEVVRGADLLDFTATQIQLWRALGATPPTWLHTPLVLAPDGAKLAKRHASTSIRELRDLGWSPDKVWRTVLPWLGSDASDLASAAACWSATAGPLGPIRLAPPEGADLTSR